MFAVPLTAGTQHFVDIEGAPTSKGTLTDPYLRGIYNGRATALAGTANGDARVGFNAGAVFTPATTGTYQIAAGGNGSSTGRYRVFARADDFRGAMDTYGPFGAIAPGAAGAAGVVNYAFDRDLFQVALVAGTTYYIDLEGTATGQGSIGDAYISAIHDPSGAALAGLSDDDGGVGANARIAFTAASSGEYTINAGGWGGWTGSNRLFVRPDDFKSTFEGNGTIGSIAPGGTATGAIDSVGDQDFFAVTLAANHLYRIEQRGAPTGSGTLADPFLRGVYNAGGTLLANSTNDDSNGGRNATVEFLATSTGTYYVAAGAYSSHQGSYQLAVTDLTAPDLAGNTTTTGTIALGGAVRGLIETAGEVDWYRATRTGGVPYVIDLESIGDSANPVDDPYIRGIYNSAGGLIPNTSNDDYAGERDSRVLYTPVSSGTYSISAGAYSSNSGEFRLSLSSTTVTDGVSNTIASSKASVAVGSAYNGSINTATDVDWIGFAATAGTTYQVRLSGFGVAGATLADPVMLGVYAPNRQVVPSSGNDDFGGTRNAQSTFTAAQTGTYLWPPPATATGWAAIRSRSARPPTPARRRCCTARRATTPTALRSTATSASISARR